MQTIRKRTKVQIENAESYIRKIRNPAKRAYAIDYWYWLAVSPPDADPHHPGLSTMAAQAVRLNLREINTRP